MLALIAALSTCTACAQLVKHDDAKVIASILNNVCADMVNQNIEGTTWYFEPDIIIYDLLPPLISDAKTVQEGNKVLHAIIDGPFHCTYEDIKVRMLGLDYALSGSIIHASAMLKTGASFDMRMRSTDIWERTKNGWRAIHEHTSVPVDPVTGKAFFTLPLNYARQ